MAVPGAAAAAGVPGLPFPPFPPCGPWLPLDPLDEAPAGSGAEAVRRRNTSRSYQEV